MDILLDFRVLSEGNILVYKVELGLHYDDIATIKIYTSSSKAYVFDQIIFSNKNDKLILMLYNRVEDESQESTIISIPKYDGWKMFSNTENESGIINVCLIND